MAKVASDFEKIINDGRERKKNEALADKIFSKNRRQSAPSKLKAAPGPSLASRVGVKKRNSSINLRPNKPTGNVNGEWTHDLHSTVNGDSVRSNPLSARITTPGSKKAKRASRLSAAIDRMDTSSDAPQQVNIIKPAANPMGLTIRGLAGPFSVMAQNFAPGTTAADIESAMTPIGGEMVSCKIIKTKPIMIVEMAFSSREGGERVIDTFNDKTADGRLIKVYPKIGGYQPEKATPPANAPSGPRGSRTGKNAAHNDNVVDGSMGFPDLIEKTANSNANGSSSRSDKLYSDRLVNGNRRGRGGQRGRGGR